MTSLYIMRTIARNSQLGPTAAFIYDCIADHCWQDCACFPCMETLAEAGGCSVRSAKQHVQRLALAGYITVKRRPNKTNVYTILDAQPEVQNLHVRSDGSAEFARAEVQETTEVQNLHANVVDVVVDVAFDSLKNEKQKANTTTQQQHRSHFSHDDAAQICRWHFDLCARHLTHHDLQRYGDALHDVPAHHWRECIADAYDVLERRIKCEPVPFPVGYIVGTLVRKKQAGAHEYITPLDDTEARRKKYERDFSADFDAIAIG